jgi:glycosyltransferase involved in cell wall biosynthesis
MIDVIIPTYNRAQALTKVLPSYFSQQHLNKIIFVDDCSTDITKEYVAELAKQYPGKVQYHLMSEKTSLPNIRNVGVGLATSEYIFMGEDDVLLPENHFAILLQKLHQYDADIIGGRRIYMWADQTPETARVFADRIKDPVFVTVPFEAYFEHPVDVAQSVNRLHSNVLMKRSLFEKVQYDPWYRGNAFREETDFFLRAWDAGFRLWLIPDTLSYHLKNTPLNSSGGARKNRWLYEWQVLRNTAHMFFKNRLIFTQKLHVGNIYLFFIECSIARYTYAIRRRLSQWLHKKQYASSESSKT